MPMTTSQSPVAPLISFEGLLCTFMILPIARETGKVKALWARGPAATVRAQGGLTMITRRRTIKLATASALAAALPRPALAQTAWPSRFVKLVVPFAAGGANEAFARNLATKLSEIWGQQVVIENKPGAGGNIGAELVARADPDGYTMLISSFPHAVNRFLYPSVGYDLISDFAPVTVIGASQHLMVVPNSSPANTVGVFLAA